MSVCDQLAVFASQSLKKQLQASADCTLYNGLSQKNRHGWAAVKPRNNKRLSNLFHVVFCLNTKGYKLVRCVLTFIEVGLGFHCSVIPCLFGGLGGPNPRAGYSVYMCVQRCGFLSRGPSAKPSCRLLARSGLIGAWG